MNKPLCPYCETTLEILGKVGDKYRCYCPCCDTSHNLDLGEEDLEGWPAEDEMDSLVQDACEAESQCPVDELEDYAFRLRLERSGRL